MERFIKRLRLQSVISFMLILSTCTFDLGVGLYANIFDCHDRNHPLMYVANSATIELCCELRNCNSTERDESSDLVLCSPHVCSDNNTTKNGCMAKLEVHNISKSDEGTYKCKKGGQFLDIKDVLVVEKLEDSDIGNLTFVCTELGKVTVTFDLWRWSSQYSHEFEVTMQKPGTNIMTLCKNETVHCDANGKVEEGHYHCVCEYSNETNPDDTKPAHLKVTIFVKVSRASLSAVKIIKTFNMIHNVHPQNIGNLLVKSITHNTATLELCPPYEIQRLKNFIQYKVVVNKAEGLPELLEFQFMLDDFAVCIAVSLPNLTAFTMYTAAISAVGGGGESNSSIAEFTTNSTVPDHPPCIDSFSFTRVDDTDGQSALLLMWHVNVKNLIWRRDTQSPSKFINYSSLQPLPHEAQGGPNLTYNLEISAAGNFSKTLTDVSKSYIVLKSGVPLGPLTVNISSQNEAGRSTHSTSMEIPLLEDSTNKVDTFVEFQGGVAKIFISIPETTEISTLLIHWCRGKNHDMIDGLVICEEYPHTIQISPNYTQGSYVQYKFSFVSESVNDCQVVHEARDVLYSTGSMGTRTQPKAVSACVTHLSFTHYHQDMASPDAFQLCDEMKMASSELSHNGNFSDVAKGNNSDILSSSGSRTEMEENRDESCRKEVALDCPMPTPVVVHPRLLVSVNSTGGWSGMMPVNCYFNQSADKVKLKMNQVADSQDKSRMILKWEQECDKNSPQQFVAYFFEVYTSEDDSCEENVVLVQEERIINKFFQPCEILLPSNTKFACVRAYKEDPSQFFTLEAKAIVYHPEFPEGMSSATIVIIFMMIIVCGIIGVGIMCFVRYCIGRRRHLRNQRFFDQPLIVIQQTEENKSTQANGGHAVAPDVPERMTLLDVKNSPSLSLQDAGLGSSYSISDIHENLDDTERLEGSRNKTSNPTKRSDDIPKNNTSNHPYLSGNQAIKEVIEGNKKNGYCKGAPKNSSESHNSYIKVARVPNEDVTSLEEKIKPQNDGYVQHCEVLSHHNQGMDDFSITPTPLERNPDYCLITGAMVDEIDEESQQEDSSKGINSSNSVSFERNSAENATSCNDSEVQRIALADLGLDFNHHYSDSSGEESEEVIDV